MKTNVQNFALKVLENLSKIVETEEEEELL